MDEPDIEIYELGAPPPVGAGPARIGRPAPRRLPILAGLGLTAVALVLVAPFLHLYGIRVPEDSSGHTVTTWLDGWGRGAGTTGGGYGVRWGQGLYLGAGLVLLAVLVEPIGRRWMGPAPRLLPAALALAGSGVLAGLVVAEFLTIASTRSVMAVPVESAPFSVVSPSTVPTGSGGYGSFLTITSTTASTATVVAGPGLWLAVAGLVLGVATAVFAAARRPTASPSGRPLGSAPAADTEPPGTTGSDDDDDTT